MADDSIEALRRDAKRYRFLRQHWPIVKVWANKNNIPDPAPEITSPEDYDKSIDANMATHERNAICDHGIPRRFCTAVHEDQSNG